MSRSGIDELEPLLTARDFRAAAQRLLPPATWAYLEGGAGEERTLRANQYAFEQWQLLPRVLAQPEAIDPSTLVLSRTCALPLMIAPMAHQRLFHDDAERALALAARATQVTMAISAQSSCTWEEISEIHGPGSWLQLLPDGRAAEWRHVIDRAVSMRCAALMLTVDAAPHGFRYREQRAGFLPPTSPSHGTTRMQWEDLRQLCRESELPIILKGILALDDARRAQDCGAGGVVVSNHGGRVLDGVPSALSRLPLVRAALGEEMLVMFDSGIRDGSDVIKAIALGADLVMLGRPLLHGLAVAGAVGAGRVLQLVIRELILTMALLGVASCKQLRAEGSAYLWRQP